MPNVSEQDFKIAYLRFSKAGMNVVDLLGILPYFASLILSLVMTATAKGQATANYQVLPFWL